MKEPSHPTASSQFLKTDGGKTKSNAIEVPSISLPKGGGAMKGIDEKFSVNAVNGTSSFSVALPFLPQEALLLRFPCPIIPDLEMEFLVWDGI